MKKRNLVILLLCIFYTLLCACGKDEMKLQTGNYQYTKNIDDGTEKYSIEVSENDNEYIFKLEKYIRGADIRMQEFSGEEVKISKKENLSKSILVTKDTTYGKYRHEFIVGNSCIKWRYILVNDEEGNEMQQDISEVEYITLELITN